ncbi:MAG: MFS transporter [Pseudomonadales bacterium]
MFYGWRVVSGTFVAQLAVVGFFSYAVSLLTPLIREEFGASLQQVMYSLTAGIFIGMVLQPLAGVMLDRYPVRWIMAAGLVLFAAGLWVLAQSTSITQYIVIFGLTMALANAFAGIPASQVSISRWFTSSRGKALGISAVGTSVGGIVVPGLMAWWLVSLGWRGTLENLALCVTLLVLPFVVLTIRGKPADVGLLPEGGAAGVAAPVGIPELTTKDILSNPGFWQVGLSIGLMLSVYISVLANIAPYATDLGVSAAQASTLIMIVAVAGLVGKLVFGMAADKVNLKIGLSAAITLLIASLLIMAMQPGYFVMLISAVLLGLASGGMVPVWGLLMASVFGLVSYGRAMGLMGPLISLLIMPGFTIVGWLHGFSGSYQLGLLVFAATLVLAVLSIVPLKLAAPQASSE